MRKIAITGLLSAGKSTFCRTLSKSGAYVLIADEITHQLLDHNETIKSQVIALFGDNVLKDNRIDRKKVAELAFSQKDRLQKLEGIIHPKIRDRILSEYQKVQKEGKYPWFVVECPLVGALGLNDWFDATIHITADRDLCLERAQQMGYTKEQYEQRMQYMTDFQENATQTVSNNGNLEEFTQKAKELLAHL